MSSKMENKMEKNQQLLYMFLKNTVHKKTVSSVLLQSKVTPTLKSNTHTKKQHTLYGLNHTMPK